MTRSNDIVAGGGWHSEHHRVHVKALSFTVLALLWFVLWGVGVALGLFVHGSREFLRLISGHWLGWLYAVSLAAHPVLIAVASFFWFTETPRNVVFWQRRGGLHKLYIRGRGHQ
jgi:hypothetical protein